jgi:hypothetical protein
VETDQSQDPLLRLLGPDERLEVHAPSTNGTLAVTDRRIILADGERVVLDMAFEGLRRIQFDIERSRMATLVVVPDEVRAAPVVVGVQPEHIADVARVLATIGRRIALLDGVLPERDGSG